MTFAKQVINFHRQLKPSWKIPEEISILYPFEQEETHQVFEAFYRRYFDDHRKRRYLFGINPGRFGAGITGIPFTDPVVLESQCGISNTFTKKRELSSLFVYDLIDALGGIESFYQNFYITSLCPLGFIKDGKNLNYYDDKNLMEAVLPHILNNIREQKIFGCDQHVAYSMGRGKNYDFFLKINDQYGFFERIIALPHPRWVMQYRLKMKNAFVDEYIKALTG